MTNPMAMTQQFETKHTPIGKIPAEWSYVTIGMIAKVCAGGTPSREVPDYWNGTIPWMGTGKIDFRTIREPKEHITEAGLAASSTRLFPVGTLLIAMIGQGDTRGKVAVLGIACCVNQNCAAIVPTQGDSSEYLFHFLVHNYRRTRAIGNAGGVGNMNAAMVRGIGIPLPPPPRAAEDRRSPLHLGPGHRADRETGRRQGAPQEGPHATAPHRPTPLPGVRGNAVANLPAGRGGQGMQGEEHRWRYWRGGPSGGQQDRRNGVHAGPGQRRLDTSLPDRPHGLVRVQPHAAEHRLHRPLDWGIVGSGQRRLHCVPVSGGQARPRLPASLPPIPSLGTLRSGRGKW